MRRLWEPAAYGPQGDCFWATGAPVQDWPALRGEARADVAVIGGGFTGLNAALALAEAGADVAVFDENHPGWGASGRNGGFCCLGGALAPDTLLCRRHGAAGLADWRAAERAAVGYVAGLIDRHGWAVDRHSEGEVTLAHTPRAYARLLAEADAAAGEADAPRPIPPDRLRQHGLGGPWHGASHRPTGFALNPRKYLGGLADAARGAGARLHAHTRVTGLARDGGRWRLATPAGAVRAETVILATNGYSSEDLPPWLSARTLPVLSNVIVTRPLTDAERAAQGWTSDLMAYDTRALLHYFRAMPDGRFLFGMRGGLRATPGARRAISARIRRDFARLFPAWAGVQIDYEWSGLVCLMARLTPFCGPVPGHPGLFAALGYHGNGVAMGSYAGALAADRVLGRKTDRPDPALLRDAPRRFPLGRFRRTLLRPAYAVAEALDL